MLICNLDSTSSDLIDKFSVTVANPPFQLIVSELNKKAIPLWTEFIKISSIISNKACFINPARWMTTTGSSRGSDFDEVKEIFFKAGNLSKLVTFPDGYAFGDEVGITGGVSIELINFHKNDGLFQHFSYNAEVRSFDQRELRNDDVTDFILDEIDHEIVQKVLASRVGPPMSDTIYNTGKSNRTKQITQFPVGYERSDYGFRSKRLLEDTHYFITEAEKVSGVEYIKVYYLDAGAVKERFLPLSEVAETRLNGERLAVWKLCFTRSNPNALHKRHVVISEPNSLTTDTWMGKNFTSRRSALNFHSYLSTVFYRYLLGLKATGVSVLANAHSFVPDLEEVTNPRTRLTGYDSDWTDEDLQKIFENVLTTKEWEHINEIVTGSTAFMTNE